MPLATIPLLFTVVEVKFKQNSRAEIVLSSVNGLAIGSGTIEVPSEFAETVRPGDSLGGPISVLASRDIANLQAMAKGV